MKPSSRKFHKVCVESFQVPGINFKKYVTTKERFMRIVGMVMFEGTLVIGLILRSLWGLYKIHETLWFYLVAL